MSWCEDNSVDFVFGLARNQRLRKIIGAPLHAATQQWKQTGKPARVFSEFSYQTKKTKKGGWDRGRRVVAKAEHIDGKENPRFVVTSLRGEAWAAQALYEELYCARGDRENRIKEQFSLFADRVSTETMRANQMRLYLSTMTYVLMSGFPGGATVADYAIADADQAGLAVQVHETEKPRRVEPPASALAPSKLTAASRISSASSTAGITVPTWI